MRKKRDVIFITLFSILLFIFGCDLGTQAPTTTTTEAQDLGYSISGDTASVTNATGLSAVLKMNTIKTVSLLKSTYEGDFDIVYGQTINGGESIINGSLTANKSGTTIKNLTVSKNFTAASSIGSGELTLENVIVNGETDFSGGGSNSIYVKGSSIFLGQVFIKKVGLSLKVTSTVSFVSKVNVQASGITLAKAETTGDFGKVFNNVSVTADSIVDIPVVTLSIEKASKITVLSSITNISVTVTGASIQVATSVTVAKIAATVSFTLDNKGTVAELQKTSDVTVAGDQGTITKESTIDDSTLVDLALAKLDIGYIEGNTKDYVTGSLTLPKNTTDFFGATIEWTSSDVNAVNISTGAVTRSDADKAVKLRATITKGTASKTKEFTIVIKASTTQSTPDDVLVGIKSVFYSQENNFNPFEERFNYYGKVKNASGKITIGGANSGTATLKISATKTSGDAEIAFTSFKNVDVEVSGTAKINVVATGITALNSFNPVVTSTSLSGTLTLNYKSSSTGSQITKTLDLSKLSKSSTGYEFPKDFNTFYQDALNTASIGSDGESLKTFVKDICKSISTSVIVFDTATLPAGTNYFDASFGPILKALVPSVSISDAEMSVETDGLYSGSAKFTGTVSKSAGTVGAVGTVTFTDYKNTSNGAVLNGSFTTKVNGSTDALALLNLLSGAFSGKNVYKEMTTQKVDYSGVITGTITCSGAYVGTLTFDSLGMSSNFVMVPPSMGDIPMLYNATGKIVVNNTKSYDPYNMEDVVLKEMPWADTLEEKVIFKVNETLQSVWFNIYKDVYIDEDTSFSLTGKVGGTASFEVGTYQYSSSTYATRYMKKTTYTNYQNLEVVLNGTMNENYEIKKVREVYSYTDSSGKVWDSISDWEETTNGYYKLETINNRRYMVYCSDKSGNYDYKAHESGTLNDGVTKTYYYDSYSNYWIKNTGKGKYKLVTEDYGNGYTQTYMVKSSNNTGDYDYVYPYNDEKRFQTMSGSINFDYKGIKGTITPVQNEWGDYNTTIKITE